MRCLGRALRAAGGVVLLAACAAALVPRPADDGGYTAALDHWSAALTTVRTAGDAARLAAQVPNVIVAGRGADQAQVPMGWLRRGLQAASRQPSAISADVARLRQRLDLLRADAAARGGTEQFGRSREQLATILQRPEFRAVAAPSTWDRLRARLSAALVAWLERLFAPLAMSPSAGRFLLWVPILAALGGLGWLLLSLLGARRAPPVEAPEAAPEELSWRALLAAARRAVEAGEWAQAVRTAYWAGAAYFAAHGVWRLDAARTPREYLRLLHTDDPGREAWRSLVEDLESLLYRGRAATAADARAALARLEALGCR